MAFPMSPGATKRNLHSVHKNGWMDRRMGGWINGQADEMIYGYGWVTGFVIPLSTRLTQNLTQDKLSVSKDLTQGFQWGSTGHSLSRLGLGENSESSYIRWYLFIHQNLGVFMHQWCTWVGPWGSIPFFKTIIDFRTALPVHEQYVILFSEYQPRDRTKPAPRLAVCWILSFASPV